MPSQAPPALILCSVQRFSAGATFRSGHTTAAALPAASRACEDTGMSEEMMAAAPSGGGTPRNRTAGIFHPEGSEATRQMREQARRRREAEAKLQLHLMQTHNKHTESPDPVL